MHNINAQFANKNIYKATKYVKCMNKKEQISQNWNALCVHYAFIESNGYAHNVKQWTCTWHYCGTRTWNIMTMWRKKLAKLWSIVHLCSQTNKSNEEAKPHWIFIFTQRKLNRQNLCDYVWCAFKENGEKSNELLPIDWKWYPNCNCFQSIHSYMYSWVHIKKFMLEWR